MRVCDLTTLYVEDPCGGGVNTYLLEKARYLGERPGCDHLMIVPGERDACVERFGTRIHTIRSRSLPSNPMHRVLTNFGKVRRLLAAEAPDVVEVDSAYLLGKVARSALAGRDVPVIGFYHVHLPTFIARPRASRFGALVASTAERFAWRYVEFCNRVCDRVVVSSPDMVSRLKEAGYERLDHVPLGVNVDLFHPRRERPAGGPRVLLYVGRLSPEKDLPVLLDAFARLAPREDYRLHIVGDGPLLADLRRQAGGDPRVEFFGAIPYGEDLAARYAVADVLVVPSPNETFSLTVLEGLAAGLPVVAIDQGGPRDILGGAPEVGALAAPGDAADLARCLERVATAAVSPAACRAHAAERYSWARTFERLLEVYERARAERGARSVALRG